MTRKEALRQAQQETTLVSLGFTEAEVESLRRISMTLQRWYELECGNESGCIERNETSGRATWRSAHTGRAVIIADRETGARKRLARILKDRNKRQRVSEAIGDVLGPATSALTSYVQTDPRGAALYIIRPGDVPDGADVSGYYSRGVCVY